ncbi:nucleoside-diphosphate kinase [Nonomuraea sp. NPDC049649]|uniref:nucleoside-diphosphate kinase n=1 Tax=Nonomuraea sp. NPDC049649 TaxID=3155776 RepID=UPI003439AC0B
MPEIVWDRTVLFLFPPDALMRHLVTPVLERLEKHGFEPIRYEVLWHRPPGQDAFHETKITSVWKAYFYRQVDAVFDLGPSLALLVEDRSPAPDPHLRLRALKGASDPAAAEPGTIRRDLRGVNVLLDLVHSADSPEDSRHEAGIFMGGGYGTPLDGDLRPLRDLVALLEAGTPRESREFDDVRAGLRARVVAALWHELDDEARKLAPELAVAARDGAGAELAALLPARHPLADFLACDFLPGGERHDLRRAAARLAVYGVSMDRWEHAVLQTSMLFPPLRRWQ